MSCTSKKFSNISTLALDVMPLILSLDILIVSIFPLRWGVGNVLFCIVSMAFRFYVSGVWSCCVFFRAADLRSHQRAFFLVFWCCLVSSLFPFSSIWTISISAFSGLRPTLTALDIGVFVALLCRHSDVGGLYVSARLFPPLVPPSCILFRGLCSVYPVFRALRPRRYATRRNGCLTRNAGIQVLIPSTLVWAGMIHVANRTATVTG